MPFKKGQSGNPQGRRRNVPNKATAARQAEISASGLTPLDYMLKTLRDETRDHAERMDAAYKAAPYVHPKRAPVDGEGDTAPVAVIYTDRPVPR